MSKLYVAYGSNLNMEQMRHRCPTAKFVGTGVIENYELQFKGSPYGAHATIAPKQGSSVPVGLWRIQSLDEKYLDRYEGFPNYYFKRDVPVTMDSRTVRGMAYIMDLRMDYGYPSVNYYNIVERGYRDCGLDTGVLEQALSDSCQKAEQRIASQQDSLQML